MGDTTRASGESQDEEHRTHERELERVWFRVIRAGDDYYNEPA